MSHAWWTQGTGGKFQLVGAAVTPPQTSRVRTAERFLLAVLRAGKTETKVQIWLSSPYNLTWHKGCSSSLGSFLYKRRSSQSQGSTPHSPSHCLRFQHRTLPGHRHADHSGAPSPDSPSITISTLCASVESIRREEKLMHLQPHSLSGAFIPSVRLFFLNLNFVLSSSPASASSETSSLIPLQVLGPENTCVDLGSVWTLGRYLNP